MWVSGQDIHFSQSFHAPVLLNPAETGNFFGDWRVVNNYRQQWTQIGKPLSTLALSFDRQFYIGKQRLSGGIAIVHDESGDFRLIHQKLLGSVAYHHTTKSHTFHIGIQAGYVRKQLDLIGASLPDQYDIEIGGFNSALETQDQLFAQKEEYLDVNIGGIYSWSLSRFRPEIGFALYHINQPEETFTGGDNFLAVREVAHAKLLYQINDRFELEPRIIYMSQRGSRDFVLGSLGYMNMQQNPIRVKQTFVGLYLREGITRNWDAFIVQGGLQWARIRTALSYDITVSKLRTANSYRGAIEFSISYIGLSSVLNRRAIPCNRM